MKMSPLIVTLKIDKESFDFFDRLRRQYFPPERNVLAAHLTLFHHLPGENLEAIQFELNQFCKNRKAFPIEFGDWQMLGRGVAVKIVSRELIDLHAYFANLWKNQLTSQDSQKFQPHITVQNKVLPDAAKELYKRLTGEWKPFNGTAEGLQLWHYLGGKWKLEEEFLFAE